MKIVGKKPRPRMLIHGVTADIAEPLAALVPTHKVIAKADEVRQEEWDLVVTGAPTAFSNHLYVVALFRSPYNLGTAAAQADGETVHAYVSWSWGTQAGERVLPDVDPRLAPLVERTLLPLADSRAENWYLSVTPESLPAAKPKAGWVTPWLATTEPRILAGSFERRSGSEVWCLPEGVDDLVPWVKVALSIWHDRDPDRFPTDPLWKDDTSWATAEEERLLKELASLDAERAQMEADFSSRREAIEERLKAATRGADAGDRLLLTGRKDVLVKTVKEALEGVGFHAENRDEVNPPGDRLEDLRVTDPTAPDWIAIAEVRGYGGGAQVSDLLRIARFRTRFLGEQGREPTRSWYVVNQFIGRDPGGRGETLAGNPAEVKEFARTGGLVIDTVDLFRALKDVAMDRLSTDLLRRSLRESTGRWLPPSDTAGGSETSDTS